MSGQSFDQVLFFVYFVYGLAFFGMGLTLAMEAGRSPALAEARILRPLAAFGLLHGTHEWLESYLMQAIAFERPLPDWLDWFRLGLLAASFIALILFGFQSFHLHPSRSALWTPLGLGLLITYELLILFSAFFTYHQGDILWYNVLDVLTRYLLAVPGAALAALALRNQAMRAEGEERRFLNIHLTVAAIGFGVYGLAQLFVKPAEMFPAHLINADVFRSWIGFPIQAVRTVMAVLITLGLLRATQLIERQRKRQLAEAQKARLEALEQIQVELTKREKLRQELLRHIVRVQEEERARIARELHDETSQVLTAFSLDLATLRNAVSKRQDVEHLVDRLQAHSKHMSQGLYHLVHDLRPAQLDDLGLIPALEYLQDNSASEGLAVSTKIEGKTRRVDPVVETVLFRVVQEALNNIIRHARTKQAQILLVFQTQEITLRVTDSGAGFDPVQTFAPPRGWGLAGMRERVESVGGQLSIESKPGKGTIIEVAVPVFDAIP